MQILFLLETKDKKKRENYFEPFAQWQQACQISGWALYWLKAIFKFEMQFMFRENDDRSKNGENGARD